MNYALYGAAVLLVCVAFAHSYLGERYILIRLFKGDNLPKLFGSDDFTVKTLRFAWHITSVAWLGLAAIVVVIAQPNFSKDTIEWIIATTFFIHGLMALLGSKGKHLSWIIFFLVALLLIIPLNN